MLLAPQMAASPKCRRPSAEFIHHRMKVSAKQANSKVPLSRSKAQDLMKVSPKEIERGNVLLMLDADLISASEAQRILNISRCHLYKIRQKYRLEGVRGLTSRKRERPGNRSCPPGIRKQVLEIIQKYYSDYGPTLISEMLFEIHGMKKSREAIRTWMIEEGLWVANRADRRRTHQPRKRCSSYGESVQIDGSDHDWFEGRGARCTLMVMIDDATSRIQHAAFVERENAEAYLSVGSAYIQQYGRPIRFVTDRHAGAWVTVGKSDFTLALTDLTIAHSVAFSAQSKGRVERANRTLQDRLVKALRRSEIANIDDANSCLPNFLKDYNRKFSIQPISPGDAHRDVSSELILKTFVRRMRRRVSRRMTVSIFGRTYAIDPSAFDIVCPSRDIDVRISLAGRITAYVGEKPLPLKPCW